MRKEAWHILRDWQTLIIVLVMPLFMMFLYGYALDVNIRDVPVMIEDPSPSVESQSLARAIDRSDLFRVVGTIQSSGDPLELFRRSHIKALIRFPSRFAAEIRRPGRGATIQVLIDGSDQNLGTIMRNAVGPFLQRATLVMLQVPMQGSVTVNQTVLYNPQQKSAQFFVPGLMVIILMMISALLTTLTVTREKEFGTMEQLLISPLRPTEILVGKITPYILLAALDGIMILIVGRYVFDVHIAGNLWLLAGASLVYIFVALAFGLLVSTAVQKQIHAMLVVMPMAILPTVMLSGFIFPLTSMPIWLRVISAIVPPTYFLRIARGIILKGVGVVVLWQPLLVLVGMGVFLLVVATKKFQVKQ
jgi:ABC-2 type transport system permease protein